MATTLPPKSSDHHRFISNIMSRFRLKKKANTKEQEPQQEQAKEKAQQKQQDTRPPLIHAPVPLVLPEHQQALINLGWTTITFPNAPSELPSTASIPSSHPLQSAYEELFAASQTFFNLSDTEKSHWKHRLGSEEGWSKIPGEKEFITLRTLAYCPDVLRAPAQRYWHLMGQHCLSTLGRMSSALGLPDSEQKGLRQFIGPCAEMPVEEEGKTATMLRLFRYEGCEAKVVAEAHADLGLLSVVVGDVPGLEVWDGKNWFDVEREVERNRGKGATMLVGRQLERLANGRFVAGGHRVVAYGQPDVQSEAGTSVGVRKEEKKYRHSIVFVLRAHEDKLIESEKLETEITGKWKEPMEGVKAGTLYEMIKKQHFNINVDVEEREAQRRKLLEKKKRDAEVGEGEQSG